MGSAVKVKEAVKVQVDKWTAVEDLESWRTNAWIYLAGTPLRPSRMDASLLVAVRCRFMSVRVAMGRM